MNILTELNAQAEKVCKELLKAKRAAKAARDPLKAAYHKGRAEELEKWLASTEEMLEKIIKSREDKK